MAKKFLKAIGKVALISLIFASVEYLFHLIPYFNVPQPTYTINKFLATLVMGMLLYFSISYFNWKRLQATLLFTSIIVSALEIRYLFTYSYPIIWHITNVAVHFFILFSVTYLSNLFNRGD